MGKAQIHTRLVGSFANVILLAAAFWPVWCWYVLRVFDRSDEPWGLLALATAVYFLTRSGNAFAGAQRHSNRSKVVAAALLVVYTLTFPITPHLVQGIIMVTALCCWFSGRMPIEYRWGIIGLLLLSLPIVPSINFFAGYPLRLLVTQTAQLMLGCLGISSMKEGTLLLIGGSPVSIDAPCSGISMLWVQLYTAMVLACYFKLRARNIAILTAAAVALVLMSNSVRAVALILFDRVCQIPGLGAQISTYEPMIHVGVGVIAFFATAVAMAVIAMRISWDGRKRNIGEQRITEEQRVIGEQRITGEQRVPGERRVLEPADQNELRAESDSAIACQSKLQRPADSSLLLYSLCVCAALVPLFARTTTGAPLHMTRPTWPTQILGHPVTAVQVLDEEKAFAADFPGYMRRFTDGTNSYFVRVVNKETRQLHPSSDCFKGMGYSIEPRPLVVSSDGTRWSAFLARKDTACYLIMEQLHDSHGHTWTDVSEWYWHALMHETDSPWWDITVALPR